MDKDIAKVTTYASGVMQSTAHRVLTKINTAYLAQYGLSAMQWFVIGFVYDAGKNGMPLNDLMRALDTTMPFITNIINNLESKDIIHKVNDTDDARVKIAFLNPKYRHNVKIIEDGLRDELRRVLYNEDNVTRDELRTYVDVLYKISLS